MKLEFITVKKPILSHLSVKILFCICVSSLQLFWFPWISSSIQFSGNVTEGFWLNGLENILSLQTDLALNFIRVSAKIVVRNNDCNNDMGNCETWWTFFVHRSAHIKDVHSALAARLFLSKDVGIHQDIDSIVMLGHNNQMFTKASTVKLVSFWGKSSKSEKHAFARSLNKKSVIDQALFEAESLILNSLLEVHQKPVIEMETNPKENNRFTNRLSALGFSGVR